MKNKSTKFCEVSEELFCAKKKSNEFSDIAGMWLEHSHNIFSELINSLSRNTLSKSLVLGLKIPGLDSSGEIQVSSKLKGNSHPGENKKQKNPKNVA